MYQRGSSSLFLTKISVWAWLMARHADPSHGGNVPRLTADAFRRVGDMGSSGGPAVLPSAERHGADL
jgi:hypothetical protein